MDLRELLAKPNLGTSESWQKRAQSMADDTQFEQDFSKLAYMFVQDRANALMPYLLGFETVERAEDGSRAIGIFGFKIGNDYYYIPAFFLNNQVKGIDMLFKKRTNSFMPLTEDWINYVLNRQTIELGDAAKDTSKLQGEFEHPNFDFLQHPEVGPLGYHNKSAAAELYPGSDSDNGWSLYTAWDAMSKTARASITLDPDFNDAWAGFVNACRHTKNTVKSASSEKISKYLSEIGGPWASMTLVKTFGGLCGIKSAQAAHRFYKDISAFTVKDYGPECFAVKRAQESKPKEPEVKVTDKASDEESARDIIEDGFTISDSRPEDRKSQVYDYDYAKKFSSPEKPGVYNVLTVDNSFKKAYVLYAAYRHGNAVVYFPENKSVTRAQLSDIITDGGIADSTQAILDDAGSLGSVNAGGNSSDNWEGPDNKYLFISPDGKFFGPFACKDIVHEEGRRTVIHGWTCFGYPGLESPSRGGDFDNHYRYDRFHDVDGNISMNLNVIDQVEYANHGGSFKTVGKSAIIPSDWKVLEVKNDSEVELGTMDSITDVLIKHAFHTLSINSDGINFTVSMDGGYPGHPINYKQASVNLVTRVGIDSKKAKNLLKSAEQLGNVKCIVKMAQFVGVDMGVPAEQSPYADEYTGIPTYQMPYSEEVQGQTVGIPELPDSDAQGFNIGSNNQMTSEQGSAGEGTPSLDDEAQQLAQQAAELGQKNVFDHAAIGGLSKVYDTGAVIDSYLPEFMNTIDRLGRILFLYYWKHEDFTERYGTGDTVEMEDLLRSTFKQLGKLTLKLKEKAIGPEDSEAVEM